MPRPTKESAVTRGVAGASTEKGRVRVSKNFFAYEFECPCCGGLKIDDKLIDGLQFLRDAVKTPITVVSGYRCLKHNRRVGGAAGSYHVYGMAADLYVPGVTPQKLLTEALKIYVFREGGIGIGPGRFHVDSRNEQSRYGYDPRGRVVTWLEGLAWLGLVAPKV